MKRSERKKQLRRRCVLTALLAAGGAAVCIGLSWNRSAGTTGSPASQLEEGQEPKEQEEYAGDPEIIRKLTRMADTDEQVAELVEKAGEYPEDILKAVSENPEVAGFALEYFDKKDTQPADTVGTLEQGTIPELIQWDERWGYVWYGDGVLGVTGCGPTSLSMVVCGLTGNDKITPAVVAEYAQANDYYVDGVGTSWNLMTEGCRHFGVSGEEMVLEKNHIISALDEGHPIICSMRPGDFTSQGHFIVLSGEEDGKICVCDPNSRIRSEKLWDFETLEYQINNLWVFTADRQ